MWEDGDKFWQEFRDLVAKYLAKYEEPQRTHFAYHIGDKTSVFSPSIWDKVEGLYGKR